MKKETLSIIDKAIDNVFEDLNINGLRMVKELINSYDEMRFGFKFTDNEKFIKFLWIPNVYVLFKYIMEVKKYQDIKGQSVPDLLLYFTEIDSYQGRLKKREWRKLKLKKTREELHMYNYICVKLNEYTNAA